VKKLKYDLLDMQQHNISKYFSYNELDLIPRDSEVVDYDNMTERRKIVIINVSRRGVLSMMKRST